MASLAEIFGCFQSLGANAELTTLQAALGIDRPSLFRHTPAPLPDLLRALDQDCAGIGEAERMRLAIDPDDEYRVRVEGGDFVWRSGQFLGQAAAETVLRQQAAKLAELAGQFRADLATGAAIFVRRTQEPAAEAQLDRLHAAVRRHGTAPLLWVAPGPGDQPDGTVEVLREGLLRGHLARRPTPWGARAISPAWFDLCRHAVAAWRADCPPGTVLARGGGGQNLLRHGDTFDGPGWRVPDGATTVLTDAVPRLVAGAAVAQHQSARSAGRALLQAHYVASGLRAGEVYVGALHVWLGAAFEGSEVGVVLDGFTSICVRNADLAVREAWQRVWVAARIPHGAENANLVLQMVGATGSRVFSTGWRLERGGMAGAA